MPNRDDELSRDERDAVSAEELLRRLKGEMESVGVAKEKNESIFKEDSKISDEASRTAKEEVVLGDPDEFGNDLESLMRMVMNMPAEQEKENESAEPQTDEYEVDEAEIDEVIEKEMTRVCEFD